MSKENPKYKQKIKKNMTIEEKTKIFINECNNIHNNFYDYSKTIYTKCSDDIIVTCPIHGDFKTKPNYHMRLKTGCPECGKIKANKGNMAKRQKTLDSIFDRANNIHNNFYDYSKFNYKNINIPSTIICPKHGEFEKSMQKHVYRSQGCPLCAKETNTYKGEEKIKEILNKNNIKFIHGFTVPDNSYLKNKPYDFYLEEYNLLIEYQGSQHEYKKFNMTDEDLRKRKEIDTNKKNLAHELGYNFLAISHRVSFEKIEDVINEKFKEIKK